LMRCNASESAVAPGLFGPGTHHTRSLHTDVLSASRTLGHRLTPERGEGRRPARSRPVAHPWAWNARRIEPSKRSAGEGPDCEDRGKRRIAYASRVEGTHGA